MKRSAPGERLEAARRAVEDYLAHFPPESRGAILRGALVSAYGRERRAGEKLVSDGAVWLGAGPGNLTAEALREIGMLQRFAK